MSSEVLSSSPDCPPTGGTCNNNLGPGGPGVKMTVTWVCTLVGRLPYLQNRNKALPRPSQGHGQGRAGRACHAVPRSCPVTRGADAVRWARVGRVKQDGTNPCPHRHRIFLFAGPCPTLGPARHPAVPLARTWKESRHQAPRGRDCSRFSK